MLWFLCNTQIFRFRFDESEMADPVAAGLIRVIGIMGPPLGSLALQLLIELHH